MITQELLQSVADKINGQALNETLIATVRNDFPGTHFTYCMDDDLPNLDPVLQNAAFNLYLVDGREHCLKMTQNFDDATGIVIAEIIPE